MSHCAELNLLWATLLLEELHRLGVVHVCLAPGSRSTPLTMAAAAHPSLQQHTHFDERGLGFFALGLAKASRSPVAIITTSGTAVANLYPAVVEAAQTNVPLVLLTGDRPPELLDCGANQAIEQLGIFANYTRRLALPTADLAFPAAAVLAQLDHAMADLERPLHINCMYREPLYPDGNLGDFSDYLAPLAAWQTHNQPWIALPASQNQCLPSAAQITDFAQGKGVIVVGTLGPEHEPQKLVALAQQLGWPIVADAQSQLRQHPAVIQHIDGLFHHAQAKSLLAQADRVLWVGGRLLSKRLQRYLEQQPWQPLWQLLPIRRNLDPSHLSKISWHSAIDAWCQLPWPRSSEAEWATNLMAYNQQLERLFQMHQQGALTEMAAVRTVSSVLTDQHNLFIGNSLPVRLFDLLASPQAAAATVFTNRGASGIDGLIASCCGVARASHKPTVLIIGDVSALHDLNSLALARDSRQPLVLVLLNNDGGSIFNLLPVASEALRQAYYRLGHGLTFEPSAAQFELRYCRPTTQAEFAAQLQQGLAVAGATLLEVVVPAAESAQMIAATATAIQHLE
ncbi:MAG: 2-succinyl-5-enolpyruvyl-6-hydroxy-3-cyclohexene-1-carboxylic-acid synthase [Ferrimonas sp.]